MISWLFSSREWSLHNPLKGWTLHELSRQELDLLAKTLSLTEANSCMIWKKNWRAWKKMKDDVHLCQATAKSNLRSNNKKSLAPPLPKSSVAPEDEVTQVRVVSVKPDRGLGRRFPRYKMNTVVEVLRADHSRQIKTENVSENGILFAENLPEWIAGYFTVIFKINGDSFEVTCALVEDQKKSKNRAEIIDTNDEESGLTKYLSWIRSMEKQDQVVDD